MILYVPHVRVCQKLSHYGVHGTTLKWIKDFLTKLRELLAILKGHISSMCRVTSGVPQGLSLLFLCDCHKGSNHQSVCAVYISPTVSIDYHKDLYDHLHSLCDTRKVVILGDFNAPDIDWLTFSSETAKSELLCDFLFDNNLLQLIQEPTHALGNILDLVITNTDNTTLPTTKVHAIDHFKLQSDHCIITFSLAVSLPSHR